MTFEIKIQILMSRTYRWSFVDPRAGPCAENTQAFKALAEHQAKLGALLRGTSRVMGQTATSQSQLWWEGRWRQKWTCREC